MATWFTHYTKLHPNINVCVMVGDTPENVVVIDEYVNEDEGDGDEGSHHSSSSGSSVEVLTTSQLLDPNSKMMSINPVNGILLITDADEDDEDYEPTDDEEI